MPAKGKLTRELIEEAAALIREGNYQVHVAQALGISEATWYRWLQEGEKAQSGLKREFYEAIKKAEGEAIAERVAIIRRAALDGNWQAAAWWLERKFPELYGKREAIAGSSEFKVVVEKVSRSEENSDGNAESDSEAVRGA